MKNASTRRVTLFLSLILIATFFYTQSMAQAPCSELFISEMTLGKNPNENPADPIHPFDLNYAVEIFNPTNHPVELMDYSLELTTGTAVTAIPLNGIIPPGDVYVVCNANAGVNLQLLADTLTPYLNLELTSLLALKHNSATIDAIGQSGLATTDSFDANLFIADPYGYLSAIHIDVNDFKSVDIRRCLLATNGDSVMLSATELIGNWYFCSDTAISDIGHYDGFCNKTTADDKVGFLVPRSDIYTLSSTPFDLLDLNMNTVPNGAPMNPGILLFYGELPSTSAFVCTDLDWTNNAVSTSSFTCSTARFAYDPGFNPGVAASSNVGSTHGTRWDVSLAPASSGVQVDNGKNIHRTYIHRTAATNSVGKPVESKIDMNVNALRIVITSKGNYSCQIYNMAGSSVYRGTIAKGTTTIPISELPGGNYIIAFTSATESSEAIRFTKYE